MRSKISLMLCALARVVLSHGQYSNGVALSHYSPLSTLTTNPSSIAASGAYMDIQLAHVGFTGVNNVVYFSKDQFSVSDAISGSQTDFTPVVKRTVVEGMGQVNLDVRGLGFSMQVKKMAFALNTRLRSITSIRNLPPHLVVYAEDGLDYPPLLGEDHITENLRINHLTWGELGLSAAGILKQRGRNMITGGLTIKRVLSPGGAHVFLRDWDYTVVDTTSLLTARLDGDILAASAGFDESGATDQFSLGRGWGVDLGATFYQMQGEVDNYTPHNPSSGCRTMDYDWKVGVALLDLGYARFVNNTYSLAVNSSDTIDWQNWNQFEPSNQADIENALDSVFASMSPTLNEAVSFRLPTTLSVTFDYRLAQPFSLGLMWQQAFPRRGVPGPQGNSQLAVVPRLEWKRIEFAMPMRLHEYRFPQLGMAIRLNGVVIGSDKIGAILFGGNHNGADIYVSLKHTIFKNFRCGKNRQKGSVKGNFNRRVVPCPKW